MPFVRNKKTFQLDEISDEQAAQLREMGKTVYATQREAMAPTPQVGEWQRMAPGRMPQEAAPPAQGKSVLEVLFPRNQASQRAGRGALAGNVETAKDIVTLPFRTAAGVGSYLGTLGSEAMDGGLASPQAFAQAKRIAQSQAAQDMAAPGADIDYPGWARGFVAPSQDPVAGALSILPLGKPIGALAGRLGSVAAQGGRLAPAASMGAEALQSPVGQGLGIGATAAGIGLGANALDRAVTPGQAALNVSPDEIRNAALQTALGGASGGILGQATRMATNGRSWLGETVPRWLEKKAGKMVRASIKPNGLEEQLAVEKALVEDRLLPKLVDNLTFTPGQIAENYYGITKPISQKIGVALAEADKAGPIYSSAQAIQASRDAIANAIRGGRARATPQQEAAILQNIEDATQNHIPRALGPWPPGQVEEAPMIASQAYGAKKINQDWGFDKRNTDPMLPQKARAEAALGLARNFNEQLEDFAPAVKVLDRELAPYSAIRDAMETAAGPRSNRNFLGPTFWMSAAQTSGARQAWNVAQKLRAMNGMQSSLPATLAAYLTDALQQPLTSQPQQPRRPDDQR